MLEPGKFYYLVPAEPRMIQRGRAKGTKQDRVRAVRQVKNGKTPLAVVRVFQDRNGRRRVNVDELHGGS